jgi:branched-chain amino acid aminotransferase
MIISSVPRIPESSVDATAKNFHWGDLIQARLEAGDRGAQNAILLGHSGYVAEGVGFNVFMVKNNEIKTPEHDCLKGITRLSVIEIARELGISCVETNITADELLSADEVFISSSAGGVFPVTTLDNKLISEGKVGAITAKINETYWAWRASPSHTTEVSYE